MAQSIGPESVCSPAAREIIKNEAIKLSRRIRCRNCEIEDFIQEITARVIGKLTLFDPKRGEFGAFVRVAAGSAAGMIARECRAEKRGFGHRHLSLNVGVGARHDDDATLGDHLSPVDTARRLGLTPRSSSEKAEIDEVVERLPPDLAAICRALMTTSSRVEAAKMLGMRRQRLYELLPQIHQFFHDAGFDEIF